MKKFCSILVVAAMMFSAAIVVSSCNKDNEKDNENKIDNNVNVNLPSWLVDFKNGKFAPELEEVVPSVAFEASASGASQANAKSGTSHSIRRLNETVTVIPADLISKGDNVEWMYEWYVFAETSVEEYKDALVASVESAGLEVPDVWKEVEDSWHLGTHRVKYEENDGGDLIIYVENETLWAKVSMYANGANEALVYSDHVKFYSYYSGNQFVYLRLENNFHQYMEFDQTGDVKKGIVAWGVNVMDNAVERDIFYAYGFEGDDNNMEMWQHYGEDNDKQPLIVSSFASHITANYSFRFMTSQTLGTDEYDNSQHFMIDAGALNILNVIVTEEFRPLVYVEVHEIELVNGVKIPGTREDMTDPEFPHGKPLYSFSVNKLIDNNEEYTGKYLTGFTFVGPFPEGRTVNEHFALHNIGFVSVQDFDIGHYRQIATSLLDNFYAPFDTFKDVPLNNANSNVLRAAITERIEAARW